RGAAGRRAARPRLALTSHKACAPVSGSAGTRRGDPMRPPASAGDRPGPRPCGSPSATLLTWDTVERGVLMHRPLPAAVLAFLILLLASAVPIAAQHLQQLEIASKSGVHIFGFEMAMTPEEQARGLMFRRELPDMQGMLFDFRREQPTSFWIKNTYARL